MPGDTDELAWWQKENFFFYDVLQSMERFVHTRAHAICYYLFLFLFFFAKETFSTKKNHLKRILFIDHRYLSIVCHRSSYIQCIHVFNSHIILKFIRKFYLKHTSLSLSLYLFLSFFSIWIDIDKSVINDKLLRELGSAKFRWRGGASTSSVTRAINPSPFHPFVLERSELRSYKIRALFIIQVEQRFFFFWFSKLRLSNLLYSPNIIIPLLSPLYPYFLFLFLFLASKECKIAQKDIHHAGQIRFSNTIRTNFIYME